MISAGNNSNRPPNGSICSLKVEVFGIKGTAYLRMPTCSYLRSGGGSVGNPPQCLRGQGKLLISRTFQDISGHSRRGQRRLSPSRLIGQLAVQGISPRSCLRSNRPRTYDRPVWLGLERGGLSVNQNARNGTRSIKDRWWLYVDRYRPMVPVCPVLQMGRRQHSEHRGLLAQVSLAWRSSRAWYSWNRGTSVGRLS